LSEKNIKQFFQDDPEEVRAQELEYAACAARETIRCFFPYPNEFYYNNKFLGDCVSSAPARYERLCSHHPGIVPASGWTSSPKPHKTGYPANYPKQIYRVDYILGLLYYHFEILDFPHSAMKSVLTLKLLSKKLSQVYMVN
jgi:hypothetical protein